MPTRRMSTGNTLAIATAEKRPPVTGIFAPDLGEVQCETPMKQSGFMSSTGYAEDRHIGCTTCEYQGNGGSWQRGGGAFRALIEYVRSSHMEF